MKWAIHFTLVGLYVVSAYQGVIPREGFSGDAIVLRCV